MPQSYPGKWVPAQTAVTVDGDSLKADGTSEATTQYLDQTIAKLSNLQYATTSDGFYYDLGGIQQRQAQLFSTASDCLDRAVYLFNIGKELNLNPEIVILANDVSGVGHALVAMDDGCGNRKFFDPVAGTENESLDEYTGDGYRVAATVDSLEGLTQAVRGINGAYNIAEQAGTGTEDDPISYSDSESAPISYSGGDSSTPSAGVAVGSKTNDDGSVTTYYATNAGEVGVTTGGPGSTADYSATYNDVVSGANNLASSFANTNKFSDLITVANAAIELNRNVSELASLGNQGSSPLNFSDIEAARSVGTTEKYYGQRTAEINAAGGANPVTAKAGERLATETITHVGTDGNKIVETLEIKSNGTGGFIVVDPAHTNLESVGGGSVFNSVVAQNIVNSQYNPGHMVITSQNGDTRDITLSDGSYTLRNGNQQVGSGSKGALDISYNKDTKSWDVTSHNLQVYAVDLAARGESKDGKFTVAGRGAVPHEAITLMASMPGKPSQWTYTSSKDNIDYYQNVYTGQTIQLVEEQKEKAGQFSWRDSQGSLLGQGNIVIPVALQQQKIVNDKLSSNYGKYATETDLFKERLGIANGKDFAKFDLATLESWFKGMASQQGSAVTSKVTTGQTTYTLWSKETAKDGTQNITGKFDYTFQYDDAGNLQSGKVETFANADGAWVAKGEAAIDLAGKYQDIVQPKAQENAWKPVEGTKNAWTNGAFELKQVDDPRAGDPNYYVANQNSALNNAVQSNKDSYLKTVATMVPVMGLTDTMAGNNATKPAEYQESAYYQIIRDGAQVLLKTVGGIIETASQYWHNQGWDTTERVTNP